MIDYRNKVIQLCKDGNYEQAITYLENLDNEFPDISEIKFDCALILINTNVFVDGYVDALILLKDIISNEECSNKFIILKSYIEYIYAGMISEDSLHLINRLIDAKNDDNYYNELFIVKAMYYNNDEYSEYHSMLMTALKHNHLSSKIYYLLSRHYKDIGKNKMEKLMLENAVNNIHAVYKDDTFISPIDFQEFMNESIIGSNISNINYSALINRIDILNNQ